MLGRMALLGATNSVMPPVLRLDAGNSASYPGTGNTWFDISGIGNHATLQNAPTYSSVNSGFFTFNGSNQNVYAPTNSAFEFGSGDFVIETWFYPISFNSIDGAFVAVGPESGSGTWVVRGDSLGVVSFGAWSSGSAGLVGFASSSGALAFNAWNHVIVTRNVNTITIWVNNNQVASATTSGAIGNTGRPFYIGVGYSDGGYRFQNMRASVVSLYKGKGFSASEVSQNFNALRGRYGI